jgi:hypothetical protein
MQKLGAGRRFGISRPQAPRDGTAVALEQTVRIPRAQPAALLGNTDRHHVEFLAINCLQDGSCREQRNVMLTAAPTKQNTDTKFFCHCN